MNSMYLVVVLCFSCLVGVWGQEVEDFGKVCPLTGREPRKPPYLHKFCYQYNDNSCCASGHDKDLQDMTETLTDVGQECPYKKRNKVPDLFAFMCSVCDPDLPKYIYKNETVNNVTYDIRVCKSFALKLWGDGKKYDKYKYDDCGFKWVKTDCEDSPFDECGDDIIMPSRMFGDDVEAFMNSVHPVNEVLGNVDGVVFRYKVVDDSLGDDELCFGVATQLFNSIFLTIGSFIFLQMGN